MATTQIHGKRQVKSATLDLGRLETNFLKSTNWNINQGNTTDPGTITGIPDPINDLDVVNKQFLVSSLSGGEGAVVIGAAEDAAYTDGLFADFIPTTPVGTAVDRFNEVLKSLAPSPAPALTNETSATSGVNGKLSFDPTHGISGIVNHPAQLINSSYSLSGDIRGIINALTNVTATLAQNVAPNYTNSRPYPNYAFGDANQGSLHLEINGSVVQSVNLATFSSGNSLNASGSGFTLSVATAVKFDNGNVLDLFKYRTGTLTIAPASMVFGYNTARVRHEYATGLYRDTNAISWIVDNDVTATTYGSPTLDSLSMSGSKYLSGVRYHTAGTAAFGVTIHNTYKNTYSASASAISFNGTNCSIPALAVPAMADYTDDIVLSGKVATVNATRILNASLSASVSLLRTVQTTATSAAASISNILVDSTSDDATNTNETFNGEGFRINDGVVLSNINYGSGFQASDFDWDSSQNLISGIATHNTGLLVSAGELTYPKNTTHITNISNGNFAAASNGYALNPDYTLAAGDRTYIRYFYDATARSNFRLNVTATGSTFVSVATGASGQNLTLEVLAPNTTVNGSAITVWKDAVVAHNGNDTDVGCYAGTFGNSQPTNWGLTLGTKNTSTSGKVVVIKITAGPAWTGKISNVLLTWL